MNEKASCEALYCTHLCTLLNSDRARISTGRRPRTSKIVKAKRVSSTFGIKKYHIKRMGPDEHSRLKYSFGDQHWIKMYEKRLLKLNPTCICANQQSRLKYSSADHQLIRNVQESFFQSSIPHAFVQIAQLRQSKAFHRGRGLGHAQFHKVKGFHQPLGLKNTIVRGSRDPDE